MKQGDLTTLENVQGWLNQNAGGQSVTFNQNGNNLLQRLITSASLWVPTYLSRAIAPADYSVRLNGTDMTVLYLANRPVIAVKSLVIDNVTVQPSNPPPLGAGYLFDDTRIYLNAQVFCRGWQNISIVYTAGFQRSEGFTVPGDNSNRLYTNALNSPWVNDRGVAYASSGVALTLVDSDPATGQYAVLEDDAKSLFYYQFSQADASAALTVTYGFCPEDLEQAVVELVGEAFKRRGRIGEDSMNIGHGQTVAFSKADCNENVKTILNQYRNVVSTVQ